MPAPSLSICEEGSSTTEATEYDGSNPIDFIDVDKGIPSPILTIDIWNDREGLVGSDEAVAPVLYTVNDDDLSAIWAGTTANGFQSMLEARSCNAFGVAADLHTDWTPISPTDLLVMGNIPAGAKRMIEIRLNPPIDAPTLTLSDFFLRVSA